MAIRLKGPYFADMKKHGVLWGGLLCLIANTVQAQHSVITEFNDRVAIGEAGLTAVIDQPSPAIGCGEPVTLTATVSGATEISWLRNGVPINGATTNTFVANQPGIYSVVVVSLLCQLESAPVEVILESPLSAEILSPQGTYACEGDTVLLQASGGNAEWQWYRNGEPLVGEATATLSATIPGSYVVIGNETSVCASSSLPVQVTFNAIPEVNLIWESSPVICSGDSLAILASIEPNEILTWYYNETPIATGVSNYYASLAGEYSAEVVNTLTDCSSITTSLYLEILSEQSILVESAGNTGVCEGQAVTLFVAEGEGSIQWFRNESVLEGSNSLFLNAFTAGEYIAQVTDLNGCRSNSNVVFVEVFPLPSVEFVLDEGPAVLCGQEDTVWVEVAAGNAYTWYNGETELAGEINNLLEITEAGQFSVQVENEEGCVAISQLLDVQAFDMPTLDMLPSGTVSLCDGQVLLVEAIADADVQYMWYYNGQIMEGEFGTAIEVMEGGEYSIVVLNDNGCSNSEVTQVELVSVSTPIIVDGGITADGQLLLTDDASGHQWYLNGQEISGATGNSYLATEDGVYTCIAIEDVCESPLSAGFEVVLGGVLEESIALKLYPNPAQDFIVFERTLLTGSTFSIYDVAGRKVLSGVTTSARVKVDISALNTGWYRLVLGDVEQATFSVIR